MELYLKVLACPKCKGNLEYKSISLSNENDVKEGFYCRKCSLLYPMVEDVPDMLPEEAMFLVDELP